MNEKQTKWHYRHLHSWTYIKSLPILSNFSTINPIKKYLVTSLKSFQHMNDQLHEVFVSKQSSSNIRHHSVDGCVTHYDMFTIISQNNLKLTSQILAFSWIERFRTGHKILQQRGLRALRENYIYGEGLGLDPLKTVWILIRIHIESNLLTPLKASIKWPNTRRKRSTGNKFNTMTTQLS